MNRPPYVEITRAQEAKVNADRARARALLSVTEGMLTVWDVLRESATEAGAYLLPLGLVRVLEAQPDWTKARAYAVTRHVAALDGMSGLTRGQLARIRLRWVVDARAGFRRWLTLADGIKVTGPPGPPWPGFPYSPAPSLPPIPGVRDD